jgi:hypothetical protein
MQSGYVGELATHHVSAWIMAHEITNGFDAKGGLKNLCRAVANDRRNLVLEICHSGILSLNPLKLGQ